MPGVGGHWWRGLAAPTTTDMYDRGAVWTARLPGVGLKPVAIVSDRAVTLALKPVVARITSVERPRGFPTAITLEPGEVDGLDRLSYVLCHDLTTLHQDELIEHVGIIPSGRLVEIEDCLTFVFRIGDPQ